MFISARVLHCVRVLQRAAAAVDGMFSNNIHPHMECGTAKTLELFFVLDTVHHTVRCAVGGSVRQGYVVCRRKGRRRITENIRVEVDGGAAVVFKWSVEHGNSIIHGLETSSIHLYPSPGFPPLESASSVPPSLSKWAFTPSSFSSFTVNCYSKRNLQPTLLVFVEGTLLKEGFDSAFTQLRNCARTVEYDFYCFQ